MTLLMRAVVAESSLVVGAVHGGGDLVEDRGLGCHIGQAPHAIAAGHRRPHQQIAEIGADAVSAAKQLAIVDDAEAQAMCSTLTTMKLSSPRPTPNQCSAKVTRLTSLSTVASICRRFFNSAAKATLRSRKIGLCRHTPAPRSTTPGTPTHTPLMRLDRQIRIGDAAAHAVLDQIGDHRHRLAVDADRQGQTLQNVSAEIGGGYGDVIGRQLHAHHEGGIRVELQHDARAATRGVAHRSDRARENQPVIQ